MSRLPSLGPRGEGWLVAQIVLFWLIVIAALSIFVFSGHVDWIIGLSMGLSVMVGAFFGARTAISGGAKFIRPVFITVVLGLTVRLAWQHWFSVA